MSTGVAAGGASGAPAAAAPASGTPAQGSQSQSTGGMQAGVTKGQPSQAAGAGKPGSAPASQGKADAKDAPSEAQAGSEDDQEEIDFGGKKYKVPKELGKNLKQWERSAQSRFQKAAEIEKRSQGMAKLAKDNPEEFLRQTGIDPDQWSEARLAQKLQQMALSPEQKRLMDLERENQRYKSEHETRQKQMEQQQQAEQETKIAQELDQEIADAWKDSGLPADTFYVKQISAHMYTSAKMAERGDLARPLTAKEAASIVKERFESSIPTIVERMDPEGILRLIGDKNFARLRDWDVQRVTGQASAPAAHSDSKRPGGSRPASAKPEADGRVVLNEQGWREHFEKLTGKR